MTRSERVAAAWPWAHDRAPRVLDRRFSAGPGLPKPLVEWHLDGYPTRARPSHVLTAEHAQQDPLDDADSRSGDGAHDRKLPGRRLVTHHARSDTQPRGEGDTRRGDPHPPHAEVPSEEEPLGQSNSCARDGSADQRGRHPVDVSSNSPAGVPGERERNQGQANPAHDELSRAHPGCRESALSGFTLMLCLPRSDRARKLQAFLERDRRQDGRWPSQPLPTGTSSRRPA